VAEVDAACESDVTLGLVAVSDHHQLLVVRAAEPHALVQQHLSAGLFDRLAEMLVLLLAVGELVEVRAPHQSLDHHSALGSLAEEFSDRRALVAELFVGVASPIGEEQIVARTQRLHFADQLVEVGRAMDQRLGAIADTPDGNLAGRVASLLGGEKPRCELHHATGIAKGDHVQTRRVPPWSAKIGHARDP
jgi:hypothetical protein